MASTHNRSLGRVFNPYRFWKGYAMVYVLSNTGQPLMPTENHAKVRILLKNNKAKVVKRCPFTIKLLYESTTYTDTLTLGVDTGSATLAAAVSDDTGNIFYMSEVAVRNDITDRMKQRYTYRRKRRNRKTRYRAKRFLNRRNSIKKDRFSPTMISKLHTHRKEIEYVKSILPVQRLVLETGTFDMHLMKNPALANPKVRPWGYQKGANYGFANTKTKVLWRDRCTCQNCTGKRKDPRLEVHHIVYRSNCGSDAEDNLITLCHTCHKAVHAGKAVLNLTGERKGTLSYATQMNSIGIQLFKAHPDAVETFGYVTKENRQLAGLPKEHCLDACIIATGGIRPVFKTSAVYKKQSIPKGDYQQTKGVCSEQHITTGKICGFRKFDKVRYFGREHFIKGRMSSGYAVLMRMDGRKADFSHMPKGYKTPKLSNLKRLDARKTWMVTKEQVMSNTA